MTPELLVETPVHTTSATLLDRIREPASQADAWERFVLLYSPLLVGWSGRIGLCDADAADLVQDVFLVLLRRLPEFRYDRRQSFRAWLHTILLNRWRSLRRSRVPTPVDPHAEPLLDLESSGPEPALDEAEYRQGLVRRALQLIRNDFQPLTWEAWSQYVEAGRPAADVARNLGISSQAVYMAKARILRRLRQELEGLLD
jgi:RNA polymerase sigma-70 factor (ECF subfamily)